MRELYCRVIAACLTLIPLGGCVMGYRENFSFRLEDGTSCPSASEVTTSCVLEVQGVGYVHVFANISGNDATPITIRLIPFAGTTAKWLSRELTIVNMDSGDVTSKVVLDGNLIRGGFNVNPDFKYEINRASYTTLGKYADSTVTIKPRIQNIELRFPKVLIGDSQVRVPPVRFRDGPRLAVPLPIMPMH